MLRCVSLWCFVSCNAVLCCVLCCVAVWCCAVVCCVVICSDVLCCVECLFCCVVLCCVVLGSCPGVLCCVESCRIQSCHVVLCCTYLCYLIMFRSLSRFKNGLLCGVQCCEKLPVWNGDVCSASMNNLCVIPLIHEMRTSNAIPCTVYYLCAVPCDCVSCAVVLCCVALCL